LAKVEGDAERSRDGERDELKRFDGDLRPCSNLGPAIVQGFAEAIEPASRTVQLLQKHTERRE